MTNPRFIIGAGLSGLIAAHAWPAARVIEARPASDPAQHKAVLRFRSDAVSRLTGIPFREVLVRKSIWLDGQHTSPNPRAANLYARKCIGVVNGERSIWNVEPVKRWVGPETLYEQLLDQVKDRVMFQAELTAKGIEGFPLVSTIPLPAMLAMSGYDDWGHIEFHRAPIHVQRFRLVGADVHQTIYFPGSDTSVYRASITGDLLTVESRGKTLESAEVSMLARAFGLEDVECHQLDAADQRYGKIIPLPDAQRRAILSALTLRRNIYSLGRFATWRNILLDDVVDDIGVIKRLMRARAAGDHAYQVLRQTAG